MSDSSSKDALLERLASLLGLDKDGAVDILDHLLSVESEPDLKDYLVQLLGQSGESVETFVIDVWSFHRGETIAPRRENQPIDNHVDTLSSNNSLKPFETTDIRKKSRIQQRHGNRQKSKTPPRKQQGRVPKAALVTTTRPTKPAVDEKNIKASNTTTKKSASKKLNVEATSLNKNQPPKRGKATKVCGCFGTKHKSFTNCLYCGRISCEFEGYSFCPFCGYFVENHNQGQQKDAARLHKERLLAFDRDFARRAVVLDDQGDDYHSNTTSSWLTQQEQHEAQAKDEQQQKELRQRKKQHLNIAF